MIRKILAIFTLMAGFSLPFFASEAPATWLPEPYTWHSMSDNSAGSMPCGGGDIGLNVWAENGDVLFYVARSGSFDENNTLLKAGRFRIRLDGGLSNSHFQQTLNLADGSMTLSDGNTTLRIFVDVFHPVIHVDISSLKPRSATVSYESWRYRDRAIKGLECQQCSYKFGAYPWTKTKADTLKPQTEAMWFYHVNSEITVEDTTFLLQKLPRPDSLFNPLKSLVSGGVMLCPGFRYSGSTSGSYAGTDYRAFHFSCRPKTHSSLTIALGNTQKGIEEFKKEVSLAARYPMKKARSESSRWWNGFWQRSFIVASGRYKDIARKYTLFRYMLGCNAFGQWPTKFNGGLFTFDPLYVDKKYAFTPDYRRWGGGTFTAQNQRLVYWPMLKSGDFDMIKPQLDFYLRILPTAKLRAKTYWGHGGAAFNEQIENFGLINRDEYGRKRPADFDPGVEYNAWLEYSWDTVLEFCYIALEANRYDGVDIKKYLPLIEESCIFFDEHYRWQARKLGRKELDGDGHLTIYPGSALETFKMAYNPANTIAALRVTLSSLIEYLKANSADSASISKYEQMLQRVPDLPFRYIGGHKCIAPAVAWARVNNTELPQLYPVFPWRIYGVGNDSDSIARNTYLYDPYVRQFKGVTSWEQPNIFAACLGLTAEADSLEQMKMADGRFRFPAFWGPGHDWAPDHNWGGTAMIGLQEMLVQEQNGKVLLFPAWPKDCDVRFRLHISGDRIVEAEMKGGKIIHQEIRHTSGHSLSYR